MFFFLIPRWVWLTLSDLYKDIRNPKPRVKYGVWIYTGLYGEGKTLSMVREAWSLKRRKKYGVYSNFGITFQDGKITCWEDLLNVPPYSVICLDELPNLLDNYAFREMPSNLFALLSQNRKLHIRIMATSQVFDDTVKKFRTLTKYIIDCRRFGRMIQNKFYSQKEFGRGDTVKRSAFTKYYLAEDKLYPLYDTYEFIKKMVKEKAQLSAGGALTPSPAGEGAIPPAK